MGDLQETFDAHFPSLGIQILGMNEIGHDSANAAMSAESDLPWLQDRDDNSDGISDVWGGSWPSAYRDVQIVDRNGDVTDVYNVTNNDLRDADNFRALADLFIDAAVTPAESDWQSPIEPLDVNSDGLVSPVDALIAINGINAGNAGTLTGLPGADDFLYDVTGNGELSPLDPLQVINHLNRNTSPGSSAQAALSSAAVVADDSPTETFFASYGDDVDDDED